jgi:hypothetical protein
VDAKDRFSTKLCKKLNAAEWNFGIPGASLEFMTRIASTSVRYLKPDLVIVMFTTPERREHVGKKICLQYKQRDPNKVKDLRIKNLFEHYQALDSYENNVAYAYWQFRYMERIFSELNIEWYFSRCLNDRYPVFESNRYVGDFEKIDVGDDGSHPGKKSHQLLFEKFLSIVKSKPKCEPIPQQKTHHPLWQYSDNDVSYDFVPGVKPKDPELRVLYEAFCRTCTPQRMKLCGHVAGLQGKVSLERLKWHHKNGIAF